MGLDKQNPSAIMLAGGNDKTNGEVFATARGWERDLGNGQTELLHACTGLDIGIVAPSIVNITFQRKRNLSLAGGDLMIIKANFVEAVTVTGAPTIGFDENGVAQTAAYDAGQSDANTLVFVYTPTVEGPIDNFDTALGGGATIQDADLNNAVQTFPAGFAAPVMTVVA